MDCRDYLELQQVVGRSFPQVSIRLDHHVCRFHGIQDVSATRHELPGAVGGDIDATLSCTRGRVKERATRGARNRSASAGQDGDCDR